METKQQNQISRNEEFISENQNLVHFLTRTIGTKEMAKTIRRSMFMLALSYIRMDDTTNPMSPEWMDESFYYLNELAESLDPYLYEK